MGKQKDIRQIVIYGYARLVRYNRDLELEADLLERIEVDRNRVFHAAPARRPPLVRRAPVYQRGFSLLLGRRRHQPGTVRAVRR